MVIVAMTNVQRLDAAAQGAPSNPDPTHPRDMQQAGTQVAGARLGTLQPFVAPPSVPAVGAASGPQREVFGFALASSLADPTVGYPSWNFSLLSTVAFFGLHVNDDGTFATDSGSTVWNSSQLSGLLAVAHSSGTKVILTIIVQDFSSGTPHMCSALMHTATTITNTVAEVKAKGVDGVNVDYEGENGSCGSPTDPSWARHNFTTFVGSLRSALPSGSYLSVDTYASSAADPRGFFDVPGLGAVADSLFVMAYDLEYSNYAHSPTNCSSFCLGPTAPLTGYYYNETSTASQYLSAVSASKVILGVPYYGRKACVAGASPNQYPTSFVVADTYLGASGESSDPAVQGGTYATHRDANDPAGNGRWDTWVNTTLSCTRELYWDDTVALSHKYDLVNADNLRGVGLWNLNYGGGSTELWQLLAAKFSAMPLWSSLGGSGTSGPDAAAWSAGRLDIFIRGTDNGLWHRFWNGSQWGTWEDLGGVLTSDPAVVSWGPNRIDVFVRGTDNGLYHKWWDTSRWFGWEGLGGVLTSGPDVASWSGNRLDVFVRGTDNALYHSWWDTSRWFGWEGLGGVLTSDPGAVSWGSNRVDVFARGSDNGLYHRFWYGAGWGVWEALGGSLTSGPDASSCAPGHLDVFATGSGAALNRLGFNGTAWISWQSLGGQSTSDQGAVCQPGSSAVDVFERGTDNAVWHTSVSGS
jgi:spore germination protein YaaH